MNDFTGQSVGNGYNSSYGDAFSAVMSGYTGAMMSGVSAYGSKKGDLLREGLLLMVTTKEWTMRKTTKSPGEKIVKAI